ncbi:ewing's tumor-associated antigen 1 isoform X2 [Latimeria chalumnae]|uniref:ewing's tumor-associated antigen 1 isoform X2 n=1 Tax=Latimeria chalumnae TaxID=7897 RepID=UPI00313C0740
MCTLPVDIGAEADWLPSTRKKQNENSARRLMGYNGPHEIQNGYPQGNRGALKTKETHLNKTPKRTSKRDLQLSSCTSPCNDPDVQQEIFWDPNSPTAFKLDNQKKKVVTRARPVEISDIVNRINPQDEKPSCSEAPMLGIWIGDDAIPCTPGVVNMRARTKGTRLQKRKTEEELMKLAKQFDAAQQDAAQGQGLKNHGINQMILDRAGLVDSVEANLQQDLQLTYSAAGMELIQSKSVGQSSSFTTKEQQRQANSQIPLDDENEIAMNALFDGPTQHLSRPLSHSLSGDVAVNKRSQENGNNETVSQEDNGQQTTFPHMVPKASKPCETKNQSAKISYQKNVVSSQKAETTCTLRQNNLMNPNQSFTLAKAEPVATVDPAAQSDDFEDDWDSDDLLEDDSFVMQITQNPELIATPKDVAQSSVPSKNCNSKEPGIVGKTAYELPPDNPGLSLSSKTNCFQSPVRKPCDIVENVVKTLQFQRTDDGAKKSETQATVSVHSKSNFQTSKSRSYNKYGGTEVSSPDFHSISRPDLKVVKVKPEQGVNSDLIQGSSSMFSDPHKLQTVKGEKNPTVFSLSEKPLLSAISTPIQLKVNGPQKAVNHADVGVQKNAEMPKKTPTPVDDWNDANVSDEVLAVFCELDSLWDTNEEDDDLLYQMCDDVEKLTQGQNTEQEEVKNDAGPHGTDINKRLRANETSSVTKQWQLVQNKGVNQPVCPMQATSVKSNKCVSDSYALNRNPGNSVRTANSSLGLPVSTNKLPTQNSYQNKSFANIINKPWITSSRSSLVPAENSGFRTKETDMPGHSSLLTTNTHGPFMKNPNSSTLSSNYNTFNTQNLSAPSRVSNNASKFTFTKIKISTSEVYASNSKMGITSGNQNNLQDFNERRGLTKISVCESSQVNKHSTFKRQLSETFAEPNKVFVAEHKSRKCSLEEIERKKQEALARRKMRLQASVKNTTST